MWRGDPDSIDQEGNCEDRSTASDKAEHQANNSAEIVVAMPTGKSIIGQRCSLSGPSHSIPRSKRENPCHATSPARSGKDETSADEPRKGVESGMQQRAQTNAKNHEAACGDLHLPRHFDRSPMIL